MAIFGPGKTLLQRIHEKEIELAMAEARKDFYIKLLSGGVKGSGTSSLVENAEAVWGLVARLSTELKHLKETKPDA